MISIIIATLRRPSYAALIQSIRMQDFNDYEVIARCDPDVNEYVSRNRAAQQASGEYLFFTDDDCVMPRGFLRALNEDLERGNRPAGLSGPVLVFNSAGINRIDQPTWGIGANMAVRSDCFHAVGGFEETWGLPYPVKGWRADTNLWWELEDAYPGQLKHSPRLVIEHRNPMQSEWIPEIEEIFFRKWRKKVLERFVPVDPRLQEFLLQTQQLSAGEIDFILRCRRELRKKVNGIPVLDVEKEQHELDSIEQRAAQA